jgi:hypothetical protein
MEWLCICLIIGYVVHHEVLLYLVRRDLKDLSRRLKIISSDRMHLQRGQEIDEDGKFLSLTILGSLVALVLSSSAVVARYGAPTWPVAFEFGSYVFPGLAACTAGLGLYWRRNESFYFVTASAMVLVGFVFFLLSKAEDLKKIVPGTSVITSIFMLGLSLSLILWASIMVVKNRHLYRRGAGLDGWGRLEKWFYIALLSFAVLLFPIYFTFMQASLRR